MPRLAIHKLCTGCTACVSVCPMQCIKMVTNEEGFSYPQLIQPNQCCDCYKCEKACPVIHKPQTSTGTRAFAAYSKQEALRASSSSGGIFSELAEIILSSGGAVYGAAYDEQFSVRHICAESREELTLLRGAKYAQSDLGNNFQNIQTRLKNGQAILFAGTPCQTAGLKSYLKKEYENLFTVDFVCHGVPSPEVWKNYVKYRSEQDNEGKLPHSINLRSKHTGWSRYHYSNLYDYADEKKYSAQSSSDLFMRLFVGDYINRESCADCQFKGYDRVSDITLGDFWGIWDIVPEMDDDQGTSLVLTHSGKGNWLLEEIAGNIKLKEVSLEEASRQNPSLISSSQSNIKRAYALEKGMGGEFEELRRLFQNESGRRLKLWLRKILRMNLI